MFLSHIERLLDAFSAAAIRDVYFDALAGRGYSLVYYDASYQTNLPAAVMRGEPEIHSNFPIGFHEDTQKSYPGILCPLKHWADHHDGHVALSRLAMESPDDPRMLQTYEIAGQHGLTAMRILSLRGRVARARGMVAICPAPNALPEEEILLWKKNHREINIMTAIMHLRMATICREPARSGLTPRQREVLEWASAGKTVAEVATILGLTPATVEKHLRLARDALDAGSTAQAILKAHVTHQIFLQKTA